MFVYGYEKIKKKKKKKKKKKYIKRRSQNIDPPRKSKSD